MKILPMILAATVSLASAAPFWVTGNKVKEIWVVPGPTPVAVIRIFDDSGPNNFGFYLNPPGNTEMLKMAQDALAQDLYINFYISEESETIPTGLSAPNVDSVAVRPTYTLSVYR